eukprot:TRINITY_DN46567_c0_g1_i1.p1 TRINITY_DN46567_c0_g1~~TRINITY_DN46567_c0_g1_i1.p1  ORF type:complete len:380 (-),score=106.94 TRINITY_DN46567_c0_g1_i1:79-1218(-)
MAQGRSNRRRPDGPEDANPMNRRLPAEVVSRRQRPVEKRQAPQHVQAEKDDQHVTLDLRQILEMNPDKRARWLSKALQQAQDGRVSPTDIYDVIAHARFASELSEKAGKRCYRVLHANLSLFSPKQQRFMEKECELAQLFRASAWEKAQGADEKGEAGAGLSAAEASAAMMEEMMARCRAFVREKQSERGDKDLAEALQESGGAFVQGTEEPEAEAAAEAPVESGTSGPSADAATAAGAAATRAAGEAGEAPLPDGWERFVDPASGHPYYVHRASGTTQWLRPSPEEAGAATSGQPAEAAAATGATAEETKRRKSKSKSKERGRSKRSSSSSSSRRKKKKGSSSGSSSRRSRSRRGRRKKASSSSSSSGSRAKNEKKRR